MEFHISHGSHFAIDDTVVEESHLQIVTLPIKNKDGLDSSLTQTACTCQNEIHIKLGVIESCSI